MGARLWTVCCTCTTIKFYTATCRCPTCCWTAATARSVHNQGGREGRRQGEREGRADVREGGKADAGCSVWRGGRETHSHLCLLTVTLHKSREQFKRTSSTRRKSSFVCRIGESGVILPFFLFADFGQSSPKGSDSSFLGTLRGRTELTPSYCQFRTQRRCGGIR